MAITEARTTPSVILKKDMSDAAAERLVLICVGLFLAGWACSVALWGIPGLYIPALMLVPVIWVLLLLISRG